MSIFKYFFAPKPTIEHPVFGKLTLMRSKRGSYWMHDSYSDDDPAISVETVNGEPPSIEQAAFYRRITDDLDAAFAKVAIRVISEYEKLLKRDFPQNWRETFKFSGIGIPLGGSEDQTWNITFELLTNNLGYLFTCYFKNGHIDYIGIDT